MIRMTPVCALVLAFAHGGVVEAASRSTGTAVVKFGRGELHLRSEVGGGVRVVSSSIGDPAGLRAGDLIVQVNERRVETPEDIFGIFRAADPASTTTARILRGSEHVSVPLQPRLLQNFLPPAPPRLPARPSS